MKNSCILWWYPCRVNSSSLYLWNCISMADVLSWNCLNHNFASESEIWGDLENQKHQNSKITLLQQNVTSNTCRCSVKIKNAHVFLVNAPYTCLDYWHGNHLMKVMVFSSIFFKLLLISFSRFKKFWNICPMEHLLSRLEADSRPVSRRIVNLLMNSFFPINQPEDVWCERCVTLIQMNPAAARKFYQYAYEFTAPTNIGKVQNLVSLWNYWYHTM